MTYSTFSIQIDPGLLDNNNGPVTHLGVLVTDDLSSKSPPPHNFYQLDAVLTFHVSGNFSDWKMYLGNTYNDWKASKAPAYLATVKTISTSRSAANHHTLLVGNGSRWEGYNNALNSGGKYR